MQGAMDLFSANDTLTPIPIDDGELYFLERLQVPPGDILARLIAETDWRAESITLWGKQHPQPRLTAWYGEARYRYSGMTLEPQPFTPLQLLLKREVERVSGRRFNSVLLNYYRDQNDSMGFHSDDEKELGKNPVIASLTFGATRTFLLKHKFKKELPLVKVPLEAGTVLLMKGTTQHFWKHGINKQTGPCGPRINLTFRTMAAG